ncbi:hypothetical protein EON66_02240 [archaeon]|nr:MAG: hypothetical protein EON66_02240 [archaeon]
MPSHVATPNSYMSSANGKISASPAVSGLSADGAGSTSVLSAFGLPSFGRELSHIFTSDVSEEFGTDYAVILRKNMAKKNYQMSFKVSACVLCAQCVAITPCMQASCVCLHFARCSSLPDAVC